MRNLTDSMKAGLGALAVSAFATLPLKAQEAPMPTFLCAQGDRIEEVVSGEHCNEIEGVVTASGDTVWDADVYQLGSGGQFPEPQVKVGELEPFTTNERGGFFNVQYRLRDDLGAAADVQIPSTEQTRTTRIVLGDGNSLRLTPESRAFADLMDFREVSEGIYTLDAAGALRANEDFYDAGQACITGHIVSEDGQTGMGFVIRASRETPRELQKDETRPAPLTCQAPASYTSAPEPEPEPIPVAPPPEPANLRVGAGPIYKMQTFQGVSSDADATACLEAEGFGALLEGAYEDAGRAVLGKLLYAPMDGECVRDDDIEAGVLEGHLNGVLPVAGVVGLGFNVEGFMMDADNPADSEFNTLLAGLGPSVQAPFLGGTVYGSPMVGVVRGNDDEYDWSGVAPQAIAGFVNDRFALQAAGHMFDVDDTEGWGYRLDASVGLLELGPVMLSLNAGRSVYDICRIVPGFQDRLDHAVDNYFGVTGQIPLGGEL